MPSYTLTAVTTVAVVVASTEASRITAIQHNAKYPKAKVKVIGAMSPVLAGFTLGLFLFAAGMANERVATLLCVLLCVSALLVNGIPLISLLSNLK